MRQKGQAATSHQTARGEHSSSGELPPRLPAKLPKLPDGDGTLTKPSNLAPEASSQGKKCPLDADDEVVEPLDHDEVARPPKKKKKKKNKSKDRLKDETPSLEAQDDGAHADNPNGQTRGCGRRARPGHRHFWNSGGGDQDSQEEKEEECRTREVPIRAEGS